MDGLTALACFSNIETERLYLRPFSFSDSDSFYEIAQNPDNLDFIFPMITTKTESDYMLTHAFLKNPLGIWAIEDKLNQELVGAIKFDKLDLEKGWAEIGYFVKKTYQGKGLATEALSIICFVSFQEIGLNKLNLVTHLDNVASQKVAKKVGFILKRQYKGSDRYTHKMRHYLEFELRKKDYE